MAIPGDPFPMFTAAPLPPMAFHATPKSLTASRRLATNAELRARTVALLTRLSSAHRVAACPECGAREMCSPTCEVFVLLRELSA